MIERSYAQIPNELAVYFSRKAPYPTEAQIPIPLTKTTVRLGLRLCLNTQLLK